MLSCMARRTEVRSICYSDRCSEDVYLTPISGAYSRWRDNPGFSKGAGRNFYGLLPPDVLGRKYAA